jgi:multidrug resistance efflux pump
MTAKPSGSWVRTVLVGLGLLIVAGAVGTKFYLGNRAQGQVGNAVQRIGVQPAEAGIRAVEESDVVPVVDPIQVKTVKPRQDRAFQMTVERPADVEAYYRADLEARVAGQVQSIRVARGSHVTKDQPLVEIQVPDLQAQEREQGNIVVQRERELRLGLAKTAATRVAVKTALANIEEKKTHLQQAKATTRLREQQFERLEALWQSKSVDKNVRDEAECNLAEARAFEASAIASGLKAEAEAEDAREIVKVKEAETEQLRQLIEVAKSDHEKAKAMLDYATVRAPFEGTVTARRVNPGSFVQNASTGKPTPILTLERTDIVTVVMRVPDNVAPFVTAGTEAIIELDSLPGIKIRGKVTRFAPSLETESHDRTMPIEVDLWNLEPGKYQPFFADPKNLADLKEGLRPLVPEFVGTDALQRSKRLMAGMYGKMTLVLQSFGSDYLIPSQAIVREGGRSKLYIVKDGKAQSLPVVVQIDDGLLAKVDRVGNSGQVLGGLTGNEEVIVTNHEELSEGQEVSTTTLPSWNVKAK